MIRKILRLIGVSISAISFGLITIFVVKLISGNVTDTNSLSIYNALFSLTALGGLWLYKFNDVVVRMFNRIGWFTDSEKLIEDRIQDEIRKRVLEKARIMDLEKRKQDEIEATLDALEEVVDLSRAEIERIAQDVRSEYKVDSEEAHENISSEPQKLEEREEANQWQRRDFPMRKQTFPWPAIILVCITIFFFRMGSRWTFFAAIFLIIAIIKFINRNDPGNKE